MILQAKRFPRFHPPPSLGGKRGGGKGVSTGKASFQETSLGLRWPRRESEAVKYIFIMSWPVNLSLNKAFFYGG